MLYAKHLYQNLASAKDSTSVFIPQIKNGDLRETSYILRDLNIKSNSTSIPVGNSPIWGKANCTDTYAELKKTHTDKHLVPNVRGMGAKDAVYLLESQGLRVRLSGTGKVIKQSLNAGSYLHKGQTITLTLD